MRKKFKVKKDSRPKQLVAFRFPKGLMDEIKTVAKLEGVSATNLVIQMLQHCLLESRNTNKKR